MSAETGRLNDRLALVTGAGSGIGKEIALQLAEEGAYVIGTGTRRESCEAINETLGDRGFAELMDLTDDPNDIATSLKGIVEEAYQRNTKLNPEAKKKAIDILVNNGGVKHDDVATRISREDWDRVIATNLSGTAELTKQVVRAGRKEENLRVITVGSIAAFGHALQTPYAASKAGLVGYMKSWPGEQNLPGSPNSTATFNTILPGLIDTKIIETMPPELIEEIKNRIPARRLGTPQDVARLAVFLALPENGYINGATITVDGGAGAGIHI